MPTASERATGCARIDHLIGSLGFADYSSGGSLSSTSPYEQLPIATHQVSQRQTVVGDTIGEAGKPTAVGRVLHHARRTCAAHPMGGALDGQLSAAFETATLEHIAAILGAHPGQKAMDTLAAPLFRLPCAFGHAGLLLYMVGSPLSLAADPLTMRQDSILCFRESRKSLAHRVPGGADARCMFRHW